MYFCTIISMDFSGRNLLSASCNTSSELSKLIYYLNLLYKMEAWKMTKALSFFSFLFPSHVYKSLLLSAAWASQCNKKQIQFPCSDDEPLAIKLLTILIWTLSIWSVDQNVSGSGRPSKNDLNSTSDLSGWENGASCDAPLIVAKESILP